MSDSPEKSAPQRTKKALDTSLKKQARRRVNHAVETGRLESPNSIPCVDCGDFDSGRRHEYDHHEGYEHPLIVEAVCSKCHCARSLSRGERQRSRELREGEPIGKMRSLDEKPRPNGNLFTVRAVAMLVFRTERTIYNVLSIHSDRFDSPMYQKVYAPRDQRLYRLLSENDMAVIRSMFPVYVKRKGK